MSAWRGSRPDPVLTRRRDGGFTLAELITTLALAAVLATIAVPSFNSVITTDRTQAAAAELYASLVEARSEAIRLDQQVTVQETGSWAAGWTTNATINGVATQLDKHGATHVDSITEASGATSVTFNPSGHLALGTTPMFVATKQNGSATVQECISVAPAGTPYMQAGSSC